MTFRKKSFTGFLVRESDETAQNSKSVSLLTLYLNTDFHGLKGLKGFLFIGLKIEKTLKNPFKKSVEIRVKMEV